MRRYQLYIFNFDNTLFDTSEGLEICYRSALKAIGVDYQQELLGEFIREPLRETFQRYSDDPDGYRTFEKAFFKASDESVRDHAVIFSDTLDVIKLLKEEKRNLAIVTGKSPDAVADVLQKYKMSDMFEHVIGHGHYSKTLPDPESLLMCISNYPEIAHDDIAYIGDSRFDMDAARAAGIGAVFIDRRPSENTENGNPDGKCCAKIKSLYGLIAECRICIISVFTVRYDLLDPEVDIGNVVKELERRYDVTFNIIEREKNYVKIGHENIILNIFPRGIVVRSYTSDNVYPLDTEHILLERDHITNSVLTGKHGISDIADNIGDVVHSIYPHLRRDKMMMHFPDNRVSAYNISSYHMTSPLNGVFESHFSEEVLQLLTKKRMTLNDGLYAELDRSDIPYYKINDVEMIAAAWDSRVFIGSDDSEEHFLKYLEYEAKAQNTWFLTSLMNEVVDNLASSDLNDSDLITETLDTMYTNATFKYVVASSNSREDAGIMGTLYDANNLETISTNFRNKAELLNQKIEMSIRSADARSSRLLNNILLALTIVSSASAVFQILGYWYINTTAYNLYSVLGTVMIVVAVVTIFMVTNRGRRSRM